MKRISLSEITAILDAMPDEEWAVVSASDASKDAFLEQYGWTIKELKQAIAEDRKND